MRIVTLILALFGFFAQLFNGYIIPGVMLASTAAILAVLLKGWNTSNFSLKVFSIGALLAFAVLGCAYDAYVYFSVSHVPGNSYGGWSWSLLLILFFGCYAIKEFKALTTTKNP